MFVEMTLLFPVLHVLLRVKFVLHVLDCHLFPYLCIIEMLLLSFHYQLIISNQIIISLFTNGLSHLEPGLIPQSVV